MATHWTRGSAIAGLLATIILGCSDGHDSGGDGPLAPADFVPAAAAEICDDLGECCAQDGHAFSAARCRSGYVAGLQEILERGTVEYDADAGGRCVRELRARPAQCDGTAVELQVCGDVLHGTVADGQACVDSTDCAGFPGSTFCIEQGGEGSQQVCTPVQPPSEPVRASRGEPCTGTCREKHGGQTCVWSGSAPAVLCFADDGLYCARATSTCEPLVPAGGSCERDPSFPGCSAGTFCEHERCVPERGEGESCLIDVCTSPVSCPAPSELACGPGLRCPVANADPRCIAPQPDGSACTSFDECASGWCNVACDERQSCAEAGTCGPPKRTTAQQCAGVFSDDASAATAAPFTGAR